MFTLKSDKKDYGISFPTSLKEITPDVLNTLLANIKLPEHHAIVCLTSKVKLFDLAMSINRNADKPISVVTLLGKIGESDSKDINAVVGDKIVIDRSSLERGYHLTVNTVISYDNTIAYIDSDADLKNRMLTFARGINEADDSEIGKQYIIVVSFKVVPVCDIHAATKVNAETVDPFIFKTIAD